MELQKFFALSKQEILKLHPGDVAKMIEKMNKKERRAFLEVFTAIELSEVFSFLEEEDAALYLEFFEDKKASEILEKMEYDDAADIVNELDKKDKENYLDLMNVLDKKSIIALAKYQKNQVGSIMNSNIIVIDANWDVKEAMKTLIQKAPDVEKINTLFVCSNDEFIGTLDFRKLIVTKSPNLVDSITNKNVIVCNDTDDIEYAINLIDDYDMYALPIVSDKKLLGMVDINDGFASLWHQREEDYAQLAGINGEYEESESIFSKVKKRLPWLLTLLLLDLIVCLVVSRFENVIEELTILVIFESMILGLAGNVGTQSLAVCVRSLSLKKIKTQKARMRHIGLELRNGIALGLVMGIIGVIVSIGFLFIISYQASFNDIINISLIIGISILGSLSLSALFGCLIPIVFDLFHIDPSAASGPFITTVNDIISLVVYFLLASWLLL